MHPPHALYSRPAFAAQTPFRRRDHQVRPMKTKQRERCAAESAYCAENASHENDAR